MQKFMNIYTVSFVDFVHVPLHVPVLADSAQPTWRSALSVARTTTSATGALQQPDHVEHGLWNTLPLNLRLCDSLGQFKRSLKTFLFGL